MWPFKKKYNVDYASILSKLETGSEYELENILWQPTTARVNYLPVTTTLLQKLKRQGSARGLSIYDQEEKDNFELLILNVPWATDGKPYSPIIIDKTNSKIIGLMLPFNELHQHLSKEHSDAIAELGKVWVKFVMNV